MTLTYVFLDTTVLVNAKPINEFEGWPELAGSENVELVLCPAVLRELDTLKDLGKTARVKNRAQSATNLLGAHVEELLQHQVANLRQKVTLRVLPWEPQFGPEEAQLDPAVMDDRIIASMQEFRRADPAANMMLVSGDFLLVLRAGLRKFLAVMTPRNLQGEQEKDAEQRQKEQQNKKDNARPKIDVKLLGGIPGRPVPEFNLKRFKSRESLRHYEVERHREIIRQRNPELFAPLAHQDVTRALRLEQLSRHYEKFEAFLDEYSRVEELLGATFSLSFLVQNLGTAKTALTRISLEFPPELTLSTSLPVLPEEPKFYAVPRQLSQIAAVAESLAPLSPRSTSSSNNWGARVKGHAVSFEVRNLLHNSQGEFGPLFVTVPANWQRAGFKVTGEATVEEVPDPVQLNANIKISFVDAWPFGGEK